MNPLEEPEPFQTSPHKIAAAERQLQALLGGRISSAGAITQHYAKDESYHSSRAPDLVAFPERQEEVAQIMQICAHHLVPVTAWGAGTSLEGHVLPIYGGLTLDLSRLDRVIDIDPANFTATVEAGVHRLALNHALRATGLFFAIDPGADATIGGMIATRASGTNSVKYGTMKHNVVSCTCVLADGRVIRTARTAPKTSCGYDLNSLMIGSEGTLGIVTETTVRLHPIPDFTAAAVCCFPSVESAIETSVAIRQMGTDVGRMEFLDERMMAAINHWGEETFAVLPTLFVEFHGTHSSVQEQTLAYEELARSFGGKNIRTTARQEDRSALWRARHNALYATKALREGSQVLITDVCVPIARLAQCIVETRADLDRSRLPSTIAGHVGDGNFHVFIPIDPENALDIAEAERLHFAMAERAISVDGTCTGEHGIGLGKRELLASELGPAVDVMRAIKIALDPNNLLNPGKLLPPSQIPRRN